MAKKLTIVVPHYKEPWEICKPLFDSLQLQHGIDFDDFDVLIVNDGDYVVLDEENFKPYKFKINYVIKPHGGLSDTRNYGIDHGDSEYIMFCDSDDMFLNNYGLHLVFGAIQEGFDFLNSTFVEEQPTKEGWKIFRREKDLVFVHGKCYRRQFLKDKNLRFDLDMYFSEDSVFNRIAYQEAERRKEIATPFYLWAWHEGSTVRKDRETLVLREYKQIMMMRHKTTEQLYQRGFIDEFYDCVCKTFFDSYYDFNEPQFIKPEHKELVKKAEVEFKKYHDKYVKSFFECDSDRLSKVMMASRLCAYNNGMRAETITFKDWLKHIREDVKA